jgi:hypothetical protein
MSGKYRDPKFLASLAPEVQRAAQVAKTGQRITKAEVERRMDAKERQWREANRAIEQGSSPRAVREQLAPDLTNELLRESRGRVNDAKDVSERTRREYDAARREFERIREPVMPLTSSETDRLLQTIVRQNDRLEARSRIAHLTTPQALFKAVQEFEKSGDIWAAIEADAALDRAMEQPTNADQLGAWQALKAAIPTHRAARVSAADRERLEQTKAALDAADREIRLASDLQLAMESVRHFDIVE